MQEIISARQAARIIGCTPQKVRMRMLLGMWPIGSVVDKKKKGKKSTQNSYDVHVRKLANFFNISVEEIEQQLERRDK